MKSLTIHIIVVDRNKLSDRQNFFVKMEGVSCIRRFRRILTSETYEKAMMFALSKGRIIDPAEVNRPKKARASARSIHLILTQDGAHWDMM